MAAVEDKTEVPTAESEKTAEELKSQNESTSETNPKEGKSMNVGHYWRWRQNKKVFGEFFVSCVFEVISRGAWYFNIKEF